MEYNKLISEIEDLLQDSFDNILMQRWLVDLWCYVPHKEAFLELAKDYPDECFAFLLKLRKSSAVERITISDKKVAKDLAICLYNSHRECKRILTKETDVSTYIWKPSDFIIQEWTNPIADAFFNWSNDFIPVNNWGVNLRLYTPIAWCLIRDWALTPEYIKRLTPLVMKYFTLLQNNHYVYAKDS